MLILLYYNESVGKRQGFLVRTPGIFPGNGKAVAFFSGKCYNVMQLSPRRLPNAQILPGIAGFF
jgi:hypothetical protein